MYSAYASAALLNHFMNSNAMPSIPTLYTALHSGIPDSNTGISPEASISIWTNYKRAGVTRSIVGYPLIVNGRIGSNASIIGNGTSNTVNSFLSSGTGCALSGTSTILVNGWSIWDAATGGNMLAYTSFSVLNGSTSRTLNNGGVFAIDAGKQQFTYASGALTDFEARNYMNVLLNGMGFSRPSYWLGALTDISGVEVSTSVWTNYKRLKITRDTTSFPVTSTNGISNGIALGTGAGGSDNSWFTSGTTAVTTANISLPAVGIYDAAIGGNLCWIATHTTDGGFSLINGSTLTMAAGSLSLQIR